MSRHKSIARTILVFKGREVVYSKKPGRGGYKYLNMNEIYCSCGYKGSTGVNFIGNYYRLEEEGKEEKEKAFYETDAVCPNCRKQAEITLSFNEYKSTNKTDLTKIWDNGNKISFHVCYTSYFYNKEVDKLGAKKNKIALTFNVETGIMYFMKNKGLVNWTYVSDALKMESKAREFLEVIRDKKTFERFKEFIEMCIERKGIKYYDFEKARLIGERVNGYGSQELRQLFLLFRYPVLQDMPTDKALICYGLPKKARRPLLEAKNINEAFKAIFGIKNKKGMRLFKENEHNAIIPVFSNVLNEVESFEYFCDFFMKDMEKAEEQKPKHVVARHRKSNSPYKSSWYMTKFESYTETDFYSAIINKLNTVHHSDLKKDYDELERTQLLFLGLKHIKNFYKNETTFVRKLFNTKRTRHIKRIIKTRKYKLKVEYNKKEELQFNEVLNIIEDLYRMYAKIKSYMPEIEIPYTDDIVHYHDMLTKTERRIKIKNEIINYSEEERNYYEYEEGDLRIGLAKTTNEMVKSGTRMNICVPSYTSAAMRKELYIIFAYKGEEPVCCIELVITSREIAARQVKGISNYPVEEDLAKIIANYFNERKIPYKSCSDMYNFEDLEESTASKQNRKQLPAVTPKLRTGDFELLEEESDEDQYEVRELVAAHDDLPF